MSGAVMREVWGDTLVALGARDPRTVVLDGDLGNSTKADKFAGAFPDRFFQMGIAEQNLIGAAAGLAATGFVPWTSSFAVFFSHRAIDPVRMLVAQSHANVKIVGSYSGLCIGAVGKTHLDVQDIAILRAMPDMTVLVPADQHELVAMMSWAQDFDGPIYLRVVREFMPDIFDASYEFVPGAVHVVRDGGEQPEVALVGTGPQTARLIAAAEKLAAAGVGTTVIHVPSIKPCDTSALLAAIGPARLVVTAEEHTVIGGLGGLVAETLAGSTGLPGPGGLGTRPRLVRLGLDDVWGESANDQFLLDKHGLSVDRVIERVLQER